MGARGRVPGGRRAVPPTRRRDTVIPGIWRLALAAKAALLATMAAAFACLAVWSALDAAWLMRIPASLLFGSLGLFLAWAAGCGFADAIIGKSVTETGAVALRSRRSGLSVRLAGGRYAEFILFNPWDPLTPDAKYTVTIGRFSRVIVRRPEPE